MKKLLILTSILSSLVLLWCNLNKTWNDLIENADSINNQTWEIQEQIKEGARVSNFNECINAGNPIMESYPRQCIHNWQNFVEEITWEIQENTDLENIINDIKKDWTWSEELGDKDIELMEKIIEKIEN